jgi:D-sedoheptulose 7-phosphate isomerase
MEDIVRKKLKESADVKLELDTKVIVQIASAMIDAYKNGKKVVLFGNGGSAADAQHIAAELVGKYKLVRDPLPALALSTNTSVLQAHVVEGDVVVGISTSGTSKNVLEAMAAAKEKGAITVGFTGEGKKGLGEVVDIWLSVPTSDTPRIQESHITAGHIICFLVEDALFGG